MECLHSATHIDVYDPSPCIAIGMHVKCNRFASRLNCKIQCFLHLHLVILSFTASSKLLCCHYCLYSLQQNNKVSWETCLVAQVKMMHIIGVSYLWILQMILTACWLNVCLQVACANPRDTRAPPATPVIRPPPPPPPKISTATLSPKNSTAALSTLSLPILHLVAPQIPSPHIPSSIPESSFNSDHPTLTTDTSTIATAPFTASNIRFASVQCLCPSVGIPPSRACGLTKDRDCTTLRTSIRHGLTMVYIWRAVDGRMHVKTTATHVKTVLNHRALSFSGMYWTAWLH